MSETLLIDSEHPETKRQAFARIGALQGRWKLELKHDRSKYSDPQRGYYFGVIVDHFRAYMRAQGEEWSQEKCHTTIKMKCLPVDVSDPRTGEVIGQIPGSITKLDTSEMSEFMERAIIWLQDFFNITVPPAEMYQAANLGTAPAIPRRGPIRSRRFPLRR